VSHALVLRNIRRNNGSKKTTLNINRGAFLFQTLIVYFCILVVVTYYVTSLSESYRIKMASNQGKITGIV